MTRALQKVVYFLFLEAEDLKAVLIATVASVVVPREVKVARHLEVLAKVKAALEAASAVAQVKKALPPAEEVVVALAAAV